MLGLKNESKKRLIALATTAMLVTSAIVPTIHAAYQDATGRYKEAIEYVTSKGIAQGIEENVYGIHKPIKRGDAAVMVAKAIGLDVTKAKASNFTDLNDRVKNSVNALYAEGIVNGKSEKSFAPDDHMSRLEMAKVLANAYDLQADGVKNTFSDVPYQWDSYVDALVKHGITVGKNENSFGASDKVTRGEFALFIHRAKDLSKDTEAPIISYSGQTIFNVAYNSKFVLPNVTATDNIDQTVQVKVEIKNSANVIVEKIDTTKPGTYKVTYSAQDKAGNKSKELILTVNVASAYISPSVPPVDGDNFSGTLEAPKQYNTSVVVDVEGLNSLSNAVVNGNLSISGSASANLTFENIKVSGDLILNNLEGASNLTLDGIEVEGETIF